MVLLRELVRARGSRLHESAHLVLRCQSSTVCPFGCVSICVRTDRGRNRFEPMAGPGRRIPHAQRPAVRDGVGSRGSVINLPPLGFDALMEGGRSLQMPSRCSRWVLVSGEVEVNRTQLVQAGWRAFPGACLPSNPGSRARLSTKRTTHRLRTGNDARRRAHARSGRGCVPLVELDLQHRGKMSRTVEKTSKCPKS